MEQDVSIADIIRPLWLKRYELIFSIVLIAVLTSCTLYLISKKVNYDAKTFYHQDIKFNSGLNQKYVELILDSELIKKSYLENGLDNYNKGILFNIIKHSSRYDAMKENIIEDNIELLIETLNLDIKDTSLLETYLNLDNDYYQLIFTDKNLTEIESKIIIASIIRNFNRMIDSNNSLSSNLFPEIAFNQDNVNLLYINDRLQLINTTLNKFEEKFRENNFDTQETRYNADALMAHLFRMDPSPLATNLEEIEQNIKQNVSLKNNLEELHSKFYAGDQGTNFTNTDTQLTVDSVSQLIELGKDFSQLNDKMELIDTIYDLDLRISSLENSIFRLNTIQNLHVKNYAPISLEQIHEETAKLIKLLNYNIKLMNKKQSQMAVYTVGEIYTKKDNLLNINIINTTILIVLLYSILHILSIYFRNIKVAK